MRSKFVAIVTLLVLTGTLFLGSLVLPARSASADVALTGWHKGILVQPANNDDFSSANFQQSMRNAAADGVNYVTLVIPLRQSDIHSSDIYVPAYTPTDQSLVSGIKFIHGLGMQVSVSLHDDPNDNQWRAMINPTDRAGWFANYGQLLNRYADIAQANNVEELLIATEMSSLTIPSYSNANTPGWIAMIQSVRGHFRGLLSYGSEHGGYMADDQQLAFWSYLDEIGVSAYYSMGDKNSSVTDMQSRWAQVDANELKGLAETYNKPLIFIEAGYVSGDNGLGDPGSAYGNPGAVNLSLQANAYQALLSYWSNSAYMKGVSFWDWSVNPAAGGSNNNDYTPQNKPAEQIMKQWFTGAGTPSSNKPASYSLTAANATVGTGNVVTTTVNAASSQPLSGVIVDLEVYDAGGRQIAQKFYENQNLSATAQAYQIGWTAPKEGQYSLKAGIFTANWQSNLTWNGAVATLTAATAVVKPADPTPTPAPTPTPNPTTPAPTPTAPATPVVPAGKAVTIWWPSNGSGVSGVQPFKALIDNVDQASYKLYWQVDGGQLNTMHVDNGGAPHQQADVDLSGWNWHGNGGQYVINFVAKDLNGNVIAQKAATITIYH